MHAPMSPMTLLLHGFVTGRIDHCCSNLVGLPNSVIGRLDWVPWPATRLIGNFLNMPLFLPASTMSCTCSGFLPDNASVIGWQHLSGRALPVLRLTTRVTSFGRLLNWSLFEPFAFGLVGRSLSLRPALQHHAFSVIGPSTWIGPRVNYACCPRIICLLSTYYLSYFFLAIDRWEGSPMTRFMDGALYKYPDWMYSVWGGVGGFQDKNKQIQLDDWHIQTTVLFLC